MSQVTNPVYPYKTLYFKQIQTWLATIILSLPDIIKENYVGDRFYMS